MRNGGEAAIGVIYHVINRGNYRKELFEGGAAAAFEETLSETCKMEANGSYRSAFEKRRENSRNPLHICEWHYEDP